MHLYSAISIRNYKGHFISLAQSHWPLITLLMHMYMETKLVLLDSYSKALTYAYNFFYIYEILIEQLLVKILF